MKGAASTAKRVGEEILSEILKTLLSMFLGKVILKIYFINYILLIIGIQLKQKMAIQAFLRYLCVKTGVQYGRKCRNPEEEN